VATGRHSDHTRLAPPAVRTLQCAAHDAHVACAVEGVVEPPGCDSVYHLLNGFVVVLGVDEVSRTQFLCNLELLGVDVDSLNDACSTNFGALDDT